ncbi:hypothetical protein DM785_17220 (plasmid) [Deinococcus actinosclerus]|nr:hypothetical protein DM785_17220 [Deinococcus actinosclerus]
MSGAPHDFVPLFTEEARAQLDALDVALHRLEDDAHDEPAIRAAFQAAHSIKGGAAMLDLRGTRQLMGAFEDLLAHLRAGRPHPPGWLGAAFQARDHLIRQLDDLTPGAPPRPDDEQVTQTLRDLLGRPGEPGGSPSIQADVMAPPPAPAASLVRAASALDAPPVVPPAPPPGSAMSSLATPGLFSPSQATMPAAVVIDVSALSRDVLARHLRALGYDVLTFDHVSRPIPATLVLISSVFLPDALQAGWPVTSLHVLSEDPQARAAAHARGLRASARPAHGIPTASLPDHWSPARRPSTDNP